MILFLIKAMGSKDQGGEALSQDEFISLPPPVDGTKNSSIVNFDKRPTDPIENDLSQGLKRQKIDEHQNLVSLIAYTHPIQFVLCSFVLVPFYLSLLSFARCVRPTCVLLVLFVNPLNIVRWSESQLTYSAERYRTTN